MLRTLLATTALLAGMTTAAMAADTAAPRAGEAEFRALYKELVETNTSLSVGSCTQAAERLANRLKAAGIPDADIHPFAAPDHPKEGGLVVIYPRTAISTAGALPTTRPWPPSGWTP